jgi:predicted HAD superfamily Cof-like phosphohydrolase
MTTATMLREFRAAADRPLHMGPTLPDRKTMDRCVLLAWEEWDEHDEEVAQFEGQATHTAKEREQHIAHIARELADAVYVAYDNAAEYGIDLDRALAEVHRANMDKTKGGVRKDKKGKVVKPPGWKPPDVHRVLFGS